MSTPNADIIRQVLIDEGIGSDAGDSWPVFVGFLADENDQAICVYDTAGVKDGRLMAGQTIIHPGVMVRVRGPIYPDARQKAQDVADALDNTFQITVDQGTDSYRIESISRQGDIVPMGVEQQGDRRRHNFTVNAVLTIRKI